MDLSKDKIIREILTRLETDKCPQSVVNIEGTWGSFTNLMVAYLSCHLDKSILYICPHIDDADKAVDDLTTFGGKTITALPAWEGEEDIADATDEIRAERLRVAIKILANKDKLIIPAPVQALCQPIPKSKIIDQSSLNLKINQTLSPEMITTWLLDNSFERVERIDLPGQFARRGGILDIYAPLVSQVVTTDKSEIKTSYQSAQTIRVEFFGDNIDSIRQIDLDTLRSTKQVKSIKIVSVVCGLERKHQQLFINLLPKDSIIIVQEPTDCQDVASVFLQRAQKQDRLYQWSDIYQKMQDFTQLNICKFAVSKSQQYLKLNIKSIEQFKQTTPALWTGHKQALEKLVKEAKQGKKVFFYCESSAEVSRINEIITQTEKKLPSNFNLLQGFVHQGFVISSLKTIVISHHELFGQFAVRRTQRAFRCGLPIDTLEDLQPGNYVVHISYGIGKFLGIKTIKEKDKTAEFLTIEYADKIKIHVSAANINLIQKYIGTSPKRPKLSKIGSKKWLRQKEKVAKSVAQLAEELLQIQAERLALGGIVYPQDTKWQAEFEESFFYQETADQITSAEQIKLDMTKNVAMDRLLCGDVGYGKTELAMRAAFKAVEAGKQVAVLVPTTVLSVQHQRTFNERFADFPITIETLNRFKTQKQAKDIIKRAKSGKVDIIIGTHRLISKDVGFRDLGLLIIDEEQRFGVEHKEKLKKLRVNVDVLTMTATPIPRTLHMSLLGLRDISSLATPPLDRRSVITTVTAHNYDLIRKAILRELNRQGQVFFLHNRVKTIEKKAREIRKLLEDTDAKIDIAHGRMAKKQLEKAMIDFVMGRTDVLVSTTIIESGLDIPNANTIFIDNADWFGLAELHQLRGRVGRYKHRAYAYMLLPSTRSISPIAARRLKAIEEYSHLGAGFRIALRDLEIRGAGNILGPQQSGHIQNVGYQMYCDLLSRAVRKLKNQPLEKIPLVVIDLGFSTFIPKNYISLDRQRMDVYRKIAIAKNNEDVKQITAELIDLYGPIPDEVDILLNLAQIRIEADKWNIKSIVTSGQNVAFTFDKDTVSPIDSLFKKTKRKIIIADQNKIYMKLEKNYFENKTLINVLRKLFNITS